MRRRSIEQQFNFVENCLFCASDIQERKPKQYRRVETLGMKQSILDICNQRNDSWSDAVRVRVINTVDLVAAEAKYHVQCLLSFKRITTHAKRGRPNVTAESFVPLCDYIRNSSECQFSLVDLQTELRNIAETEENVVSDGYLRKMLMDHFKQDVIETVIPGFSAIFTFKNSIKDLLNQKWYDSKSASLNDEKVRIVKKAAQIIREDIRAHYYKMHEYPTFEEIENGGNELIPETLQIWTDEITAKQKLISDRKKVFINHSIISAVRPRSFLSPLKLGISVYANKKFGSRHIVDIFNSLGIGVSYNEVTRYLKSSTKHLQPIISETGFIQYVFDNADINVCTLDGLNTFHSLGGIKCVTPSTSIEMPQVIPREMDVQLDYENNTIPITFYKKPRVSGLDRMEIKSIEIIDEDLVSVKRGFTLDVLWACGFEYIEKTPSWNGFMQSTLRQSGNLLNVK